MTTLVTVHGTSAGAAGDEGSHWWQRNSDFQRRLAGWLDLDHAGVEIVPFHWGEGPNSETGRREAGRELLERVSQLEAEGVDYILIGHSHGGSVIHHALTEAAIRRERLPRLKRWITIGTPFIAMRPSPFTIQRLGHAGKVLYVMMVTSFVGVFTWVPIYYLYGKVMQREVIRAQGQVDPALMAQGGILDGMVALFLLAFFITPFVIFAVLLWMQRHARRRYSKATSAFVAKQFLSRWQPLRSREDEAINALRAARPLKISLFDRRLLTEPTKNIAVFAMMALYGIMLGWQVFFIARKGFSPSLFDEMTRIYPESWRSVLKLPDLSKLPADPVQFTELWRLAVEHPGWMLAAVGGFAIGIPLSVGLLLLVIWLALGTLHVIMLLVGVPASAFLNALTAGRLKDNAFGNDLRGEYVAAVGHLPAGCNEECGAVPEEVEAELRAHVEKHAGLALARARKVLGVSAELAGRGDIAQVLADQLTGSELVHTAYFEVDAFAKLVAVSLHKAGCADLSADFQQTENCAALLAQLEHTRGPALAKATA